MVWDENVLSSTLEILFLLRSLCVCVCVCVRERERERERERVITAHSTVYIPRETPRTCIALCTCKPCGSSPHIITPREREQVRRIQELYTAT